MVNTLAEAIVEYAPMTWQDVTFVAIIGFTIVGSIWAYNYRRKP